jgi:hypothetical protein
LQPFKKYLTVILFLIMVIVISGCVNNNSTGNNSSVQNNPSIQNNTSSSDITVVVSYQGTWNGTISDSSGNRTVQGSANGRFHLGNQTSITVNFQKLGNDDLPLLVEILNGTDVIESQSNSSPFGTVSITKKF